MALLTGGRRARQSGSDLVGRPAVVPLAAFALLLVVPSELVLIGPLQSNGSPVRLLGLLGLFLAVAGFLADRLPVGPPRAVRGVALLYLATVLLGWATAQGRSGGGTGGAEVDRALLIAASATGLALICSLTTLTLAAAQRLAAALVAGGAVCALVGALQVVGVVGAWSTVVDLPLMHTVVGSTGRADRLGVARVSGSAAHPIEYSVCLALLVPLGAHLALHARTAVGRRWAATATAVMLLGLPLGLSRAGLLAVLVCLVTYGAFVPSAQRWRLAGAATLAVALAIVLAPRVVGAFSQLVLGAEQDDSITGRLVDYPRMIERWSSSPWLGAGSVTEGSEVYYTDNQWLVTLVGTGVVGVVGLAVLLLGGALCASSAALGRPSGSAGRSLQGALCAGLLGAAVGAGSFDMFSFQMVTFLAFALLGLVGVGEPPPAATGPAPLGPDGTGPRALLWRQDDGDRLARPGRPA